MKQNWFTNQIVKIANAMVRPGFVAFFLLLLVIWIGWNTLVPEPWRIDAWPFQGLNLFMSALASIQATVIGISMAIQAIKTEQRDDQDHESIIAELVEIKAIHAELQQMHQELLERVK